MTTTPKSEDEIRLEGRARMAAARRAAGTPLDAKDEEALRRCPHPHGWVGE